MNFTDEQQKVIDIRGSNVLVSAAAGSGKTAVIVERVIKRVVKDRDDISEMLIVTFTRAACEEMRGRIREAFEEALDSLKDDPGLYGHLKKQLTLIFDAPIMTIDSFCLDVIRNNFNVLNVDPAFRVADEGEIKMLRADVMDELMEDHYSEAEDSPFYSFLERFSVKKNDSDVTEAIMQLSDYACSRPDPKGFLESIRKTDEKDLEDHPMIREAVLRSRRKLRSCRSSLIRALDMASSVSGPANYIDTLNSDLELVEMLLSKESFAGLSDAFKGLSFAKLSSKKSDGEDVLLRQKAKALRDGVKKSIEKLWKNYFSKSTDSVKEEFLAVEKDAAMLSELASQFMSRLHEAKKKRNIVDFTDIEHMALEMLTIPEVCTRYKKSFKEIIIDEYQDSNRLQEEIFTLIANGRNYFCVGDVKQSIYSFRDACPGLFIDKYFRYGEEKSDEGTLLLLSKNFRSRKSVVNAVNGLFVNIMHADAGSVEYDKDHYLNFGEVYKKDTGDDKAEYMIVSGEEEGSGKKDELEAEAVAKRIKELVGNFDIEDKKTNEIRKCGYGDIVILMRSLKGRDEKFMNVLMKKGIPVSVDSASGYLMTDEIRSIINFLYCIDNPIQDIPLAGTCLSIFGGFDESELALIKAGAFDKELYFALKKAADDDAPRYPGIKRKAEVFLEKLQRYRKMATFIPIHELLCMIISEHGYDNYIRALSEGKMRLKNLNMLLYRASEFEKTSFKGLFRFIRYIEYIKKYEININPKTGGGYAGDSVRIMSIHHSKGLEFPVVFLCGMHHAFNKKDISERLLIDDELGAGMDLIDIDKRVKTRTLSKSVIADKKSEALLGEELRVLYVALTRAEQKLIMTGAAKKKPEENETASVVSKLPGSYEEADSFGGLVEYALETDDSLSAHIKRIQISKEELAADETEESLRLDQKRDDFINRALNADENKVLEIKKKLSRVYPYAGVVSAPGKLSVSELKHEAMEEKGVELISAIEENTDYEPHFISGLAGKPGGPVRGALRGTAYHTVFEGLKFEKAKDVVSVKELIKAMTGEGRLTEDEAEMINAEDIVSFALSPLGIRMEKAQNEGKLFREQPFVILVKASEISKSYPEDEKVMVQGVIDAYFVEDGKIVIVDYKTDRVTGGHELEERYKAQLDYYAKALKQLTGMEVSEKILYSVTLKDSFVVK